MKSTLKNTIHFILIVLLIVSLLSLYIQSTFLNSFHVAQTFSQFIESFILFPGCVFVLAQSWSFYTIFKGKLFYRSSPLLFIPLLSIYACLRLLIIGLFYLSHNLTEIDAMTFVDKFRLFFIV